MLDQLREKIKTAQDKDIEDRKGTQPKRYYAADADGDKMSKKTKEKRAAHFAKHGKKADDDASAYKPAPGDKNADTKPSKYTKQYKKMFGEDPCWDTHVQKGMKKKGGKMVPNCVPKEEVTEDAVSDLKAKHVDELEKLKARHERELETLKGRHERQQDTAKGSVEAEKEREKQRKGVQSEELEEGKLVANIRQILDTMVKEWKRKAEIEYGKNPEKGLRYIQRLGSIIGASVTDKKQQKNHLFLKMDYDLEENKDIKKKLQKIKGLTKDQLRVLASIPTPMLSTVINQLSTLVMGEELEEAMKGSDRSYLEKRHKMLDQLQDKIIRMRDLDRDLKNKANKAVGQARFAIEDLLDADEMNEKLDANSDAGDYIDDFRKSDAPQFKGKSDKKIRQMAIAAYLDKKDGK